LKLYAIPRSPNSIKVIAVIHQLGLDVDVVPVSPQSGFQRSEEYLALNPNGLMPTLVDDGFSLWESNAILVYLTSKVPGQTLFPAEARAQANVLRWIFWNGAHFGPSTRPYLVERVMKPMMRQEPPDEEKVREAEPLFLETARILDEHLAHHSFISGERMSLADFAVAANLAYAQAARLPMESMKNIQSWLAKITELPAWQKAAPEMAARP
jgi:glutathione S-transferase